MSMKIIKLMELLKRRDQVLRPPWYNLSARTNIIVVKII